MNITEANDVTLVLQHMIGATNTKREPQKVIDAMSRLTVRVGNALQAPPWKIASLCEIEEAVAELAQRQADSLAYQSDWADTP
jgi:hypothetical protein